MRVEIMPLSGWEQSHQITSDGEIYSLPRSYHRPHLGTRTVSGRKLKQRPDRDGYMTVCLNYEGRQLTKWVHVAVLESFVGLRPESNERIEACHLDGTRTNNNLSNLQWGTSKENSAHMEKHGTRFREDRHPRAKLTPEQVKFVRSYEGNVAQLARDLNVSQGALSSIRSGKNWGTLK